MIHECGGRPIKAGEHFQAAFVVGFFDSIADRYSGHTGLKVDKSGWKLAR
tara:strand:- start:6731 stop:6880 length:150 start_codon:yes stop_codon:yes gene_type:complete